MSPYPKTAAETYSVRVSCTNCTFHQRIDIPKGTVVGEQRCPQCGCLTIKKDPYSL